MGPRSEPLVFEQEVLSVQHLLPWYTKVGTIGLVMVGILLVRKLRERRHENAKLKWLRETLWEET